MTMFQARRAGRTALTLMALDANCPIVAIAAYGLLRHGNPIAVLATAPWLLLIVPAFPVLLAVAELYTPRQTMSSQPSLVRSVAVTLVVVALFGTAYYFVADRATAWELFSLLALAMVVEVFVARSVTALSSRRARTVRPAIVIGAGWAGRTVIDCTLREPRLRVKVAGLIDDDPLKRNVQYKGISVVGTGVKLREAVAQSGATLVIVAVSEGQNAELIRNLLELKMRGVEVVDMPGFCEQATGQIPIRNVEDSWFLFSGGFVLRLRLWPRRVKRGVDIVAAALGLMLSLPLQGLIALLIKLDSRGPVFHVQERVGKNERPFQLVKFRTVREEPGDGAGTAWVGVRDYRVTRAGRWLRLTRLDEVPQLINVLRGDVSFIGPRPERPLVVARLKKEIPYYAWRFAVKPGLTGWAQVQSRSGASGEDAIEKLKFDLYYVKNMSGRLDLWIAFKTLKIIFFAPGN